MKKCDRTTLNAVAALSNKDIRCSSCRYFKVSYERDMSTSYMGSTVKKEDCILRKRSTRFHGICNKFSF